MARRFFTPGSVCFASTFSPYSPLKRHPFLAALISLHNKTLLPWRPILLHRSAFSSTTLSEQRSPSDKSLSLASPQSIPISASASPRLRIHSKSDKERNSASWTTLDDERLLLLRRQGLTWLDIGQQLGRSRQACNRRFNAVIDPDQAASFWTENHVVIVDSQSLFNNRDEVLRYLVEKDYGWKAIADQLGHVKASTCQERWRALRRIPTGLVAGNKDTVKNETRQDRTRTSLSSTTSPSPIMTRSDQELLKKRVQETYGVNQWDLLAKEVFESVFTPEFLRIRYTKMERRRQVWTELEDKELARAVGQQHQQESSVHPFKNVDRISSEVESLMEVLQEAARKCNWTSVASRIPGDHTEDECRKRWLKLTIARSRRSKEADSSNESVGGKDDIYNLSKGSSESNRSGRGAWTIEQSDRLEKIIAGLSQSRSRQSSQATAERPTPLIDWSRVSEQMGGDFTKSQCKSRWTRISKLASTVKRSGAWQADELLALARGLNSVGPAWTEIHRQFLPGRTPSFIQGKWTSIHSKLCAHMIIEQRSWQESCRGVYTGDLGYELGRLAKVRPDLCRDHTI